MVLQIISPIGCTNCYNKLQIMNTIGCVFLDELTHVSLKLHVEKLGSL